LNEQAGKQLVGFLGQGRVGSRNGEIVSHGHLGINGLYGIIPMQKDNLLVYGIKKWKFGEHKNWSNVNANA